MYCKCVCGSHSEKSSCLSQCGLNVVKSELTKVKFEMEWEQINLNIVIPL